MSANIYDIYIEQGSDFTVTLYLSIDGEGIDTGDYAFSAIVENKDVVVIPSIAEGNSEVTISMTSTQTSTLPVGKGKFQLTMSNDTITKLLKGRAYIDEELTSGN